jgi:hypothetical protein
MAKYVNLDDSEVVYCGSDGDYEKYNIPYDMPTADVVEVVRCKDCKWWKLSDYNTFGIHICTHFSGVRGKHDFCSQAEKREDE